MRILSTTSAFAFAMLAPTLAMAQSSSTIGDRLAAMVNDAWNPIFLLVAVAAGLGGIFLFAKGLMKLVDASSDRSNTGFAPGLTYIALAAALIALPDAAGMGMTSILGAARGGGTLDSSGLDYSDSGTAAGNFLTQINGGLASVGGVENCLNSETPAACMAKNIATNVIPMAVYALFAMVFIFGLIIFAMTLVEIAKSSESPNQRSQGGITKLITAVLLMNAPLAFGLVSTTLFGTDGTIGANGLTSINSGLLSYPSGSSLEIVKRYTELIGHAFVILTFFGAWAFVRGVFMIKGTIEGRQQGSMGMAGVYIVAGVLMANAKMSTCFILNTVGGASMAAGFCT
ncbi:hypothetical protein G6L37_01930 [Agrobacterium rubi]|nr:hypothetical protein [Agrobacterium rubi]NTF24152.1 hypothetical protein [Agrobacterium rubi]